jgi:hypothetical protein
LNKINIYIYKMYGGYGMGRPAYGPVGAGTVGVDVNGDGIADYRVRQGGFGGPRIAPGPGMAMGMGMGQRGYAVDVNRDGIPDYRVKPGVGIDVNGDGIADYRTAPRIQPGPGMAMGRGYGYGGYGY